MRNQRTILTFCGSLAALVLLGCEEEKIRHYRAPKLDTQPKVRLLAAIVPHRDRTWFFKLVGPSAAVNEQKEAFDTFLRSVHFTGQDGKPMTWTIPEGWKEEPGSEMRYATFRIGSKDRPLELTVIGLGREAGSILDNVNRWRGQIGLKPVSEAELNQVTGGLKIDGVEAKLVDMEGESSGKPASMPPFAAAARPPLERAPSRPQLNYRAPDGWKEIPPQDRISLTAFRVSDGSKTAIVTVTALSGPAGGLLGNVNRWREQVQLGPIDEEQLHKDVKEVRVDGLPAQYVDLVGPESAGPRRERILSVLVARDGQSWFIKMKGQPELVGAQKPAFEAFLHTVKFGGGAPHE